MSSLSKKVDFFWWYSRVKDLDIPQPKTFYVSIDKLMIKKFAFLDYDFPENIKEELEAKLNIIGLPVFLKTNITSYKQDWLNSAFIDSYEKFFPNLKNLLRYSCLIRNQQFITNAIILREFLHLENYFYCYKGKFPIAKEWRFEINKNKYIDSKPYWSEDIIINASIPDWKVLLTKLNTLSDSDIFILQNYISIVSSLFKEHLTVDFVKGINGNWYLTDVAPFKYSAF